MLDHHHGGVGHIHSDFDHGGRNQNVHLALLEQPHDVFFQIGVQAAMQKLDAQVGKYLLAEFLVHFERGFEFGLFVLLDDGIHHIGLVPGGHLLAHELPDFLGAVIGDAAGDDGHAAGRHFIEHADIEIAVESQRQRARDGSRGHDQDIGLGENCRALLGLGGRERPPLRGRCHSFVGGFLHQFEALHHAEAVLLVYDHQAQPGELNFLLDQRVGSDHQLRVALRDVAADFALAVFFHEPVSSTTR